MFINCGGSEPGKPETLWSTHLGLLTIPAGSSSTVPPSSIPSTNHTGAFHSENQPSLCKNVTTCRSELAGAMCPAGKWDLSLSGQLRGFLQSLLSSEGDGNLSLQLVHPRSGWVCGAMSAQGLNVAEILMPLEPRNLQLHGAGPRADSFPTKPKDLSETETLPREWEGQVPGWDLGAKQSANDPGPSLPLSPEVVGTGENACEAGPGLSAEESTM